MSKTALVPARMGSTLPHITLPISLSASCCTKGAIGPSVTQRRQMDRNDLEAVVKVFSETPFFYLVLETSVGGGNDTRIYRDRRASAQSFYFAFLKHPQEFGLKQQCHLTDLVEQ